MRNMLSLAMIGAFALASPAIAENFTVTDIELPYQDTLTINAPVSVTGEVGQQVLTTNLGIIDAWCIDLFHDDSAGAGQSVGFTTSSTLSNGDTHNDPLTTTQVGKIAGLIAYGDTTINSMIANSTTPSVISNFSASIQLAIWTVEYNGSDGLAAFSYSDGGNTVLEGLVSNDMLAAANYGGSDLALVAVNGNQGLVTADPVPEPMSIALLGIGMLGLGWVRRKTIT